MKGLRIALFLLLLPVTAFAQEHVHGAGSELAPGEYSPDSLFITESRWTSDEGKAFQFRDLRGTPSVLALFYATCTSACPAIVDAMKRLEKMLSEKQAGALKFILVTFDPTEDTAEALRNYAKKRGLNQDRWLLLRGDEDDTRELAVILGSKYKRIGPREFAHSNLITLLDGEGRIKARAKALDETEKFGEEVRHFLDTSAQ